MKKFLNLLILLLVIVLPVIIIMSSIRIALTPLFTSIEYRLPDFPPDEYGFTTPQRLTWSKYSIDYLLGRITHAQLVQTKLPDGSPLFNPRELSHMLDVQILTVKVLGVWRSLLIYLALVTGTSWLLDLRFELLKAIKKGAQVTIFLILAVLFYLVINFNQLFTQFHQIFFEGDSWLFYLSDNLIRLFPLRFWRDLFVFIGGLSMVIALITLLTTIKVIKNDK